MLSLREQALFNSLWYISLMKLVEKITQDLTTALKTGDSEKVKTLRFLISQIKYAALDAKKNELTDEETQKVIASLVKKTKESREMFVQAKRDDLIKKADDELEILATYQPDQISEKELEEKIRQFMSEAPEELASGALIGFCIKKLAGGADSGLVAKIVNKINQE